MITIDMKLEFQLSSSENYGAREQIGQTIREVIAEAIEERLVVADAVEILDFDVIVDE